MVLRHVAPILLGSAFLGMEGGRAVFLGRISLNYLILILLFVKTFALNFTQKQTFVLCVLHPCSAKSVSWANIWKGTTRARQRNEDQPTVFSYYRSASVFRNLAVEHTFCTGFVILFEIMWNNAPSHSHSLSHFYILCTSNNLVPLAFKCEKCWQLWYHHPANQNHLCTASWTSLFSYWYCWTEMKEKLSQPTLIG